MDEMIGKVLHRAAEKVEQGWCQGWLGEVPVEAVDTLKKRGHIEEDPLGRRRLVVTMSNDPLLGKADKVCLDGALIMATAEVMGLEVVEAVWSTIYGEVRDAVNAAVAAQGVQTKLALPNYVQWNDAAGRTPEQVAALLRGIAAEK